MAKTVKKNITIRPDQWEKIGEKSKEYFKTEKPKRSTYIQKLIDDDK